MTQRVIYDADTKTIIGLGPSVSIIDIPDDKQTLEEMEEFCEQDLKVTSVRIDMPYCDGQLNVRVEPTGE